MIQKKAPTTINGPFSFSFSGSLPVLVGVGISASTNSEKNKATAINGIHAIPFVVGPNDGIQNWPDQVDRKINRKNNHNPLRRRREKIENTNVMRSVIANAADIM